MVRRRRNPGCPIKKESTRLFILPLALDPSEMVTAPEVELAGRVNRQLNFPISLMPFNLHPAASSWHEVGSGGGRQTGERIARDSLGLVQYRLGHGT
jgi:hypothetical protein